jgi:hypothetical protein
MSLIASDLASAQATEPSEGALAPIENALFRLDAAREKLHAIIVLAFGVPSLTIEKPQAKAPAFGPGRRQPGTTSGP